MEQIGKLSKIVSKLSIFAIKDGADRLELDIHLSKDKQLFVMHDEDLTRTAGAQHSKICELNGRDIQNKKLLNHEPIPLLRDVLERYTQQLSINVEIKSRNGGRQRSH